MDFADCMLTERRRRYQENHENWSSPPRDECQKQLPDSLNTYRNQMLVFKSKPPTPVDPILRRSVHQCRSVKPPRRVPQLDERARLQLKDLLDAANNEPLSWAQSKITAAERSGFPKSYFSPHPNALRASSGATQASNLDFCSNSSATYPWKLYEQSFIEPAPRDPASELSRLAISSLKSQNRKKRCRGCQRSNTELQDSASISNKDGNYREQQHLIDMHEYEKGLLEAYRMGRRLVTGNEKPRYERNHEIQGKSSFVDPIACYATPQHNVFAKSKQENSSGQRLIDSHLEETASNFSQQIPMSMRRTDSRISNSQLCCENPYHVKAFSAAYGGNLSSKNKPLIYVTHSKEEKSKSTTVSDPNSAKKQNFKDVMRRIDLSSRASAATQSGESTRSQRHECVHSSRIPTSQVDSFRKSPGRTLQISQHSEVSINQHKKKCRPSTLPHGGQRKNLPPRPSIRPTLLDYDDESGDDDDCYCEKRISNRQEYTDDSSSENSCPYSSSSWITQEQSSDYDTSPESYCEEASSPTTRTSSTTTSNRTTTSISTRARERYKSRIREKKPIGGFRKLKHKLGLIFHHHHHHHHHCAGSNEDSTKSMWKQLKNMFHRKEEKEISEADSEKEAVRKLKKSVVRRNKELMGHFHAHVKGVMRNVSDSKKKPKPLKRAIDDKHWWQVFEKKKHGRGVKLGNRGKKIKLGFMSKKPQGKHDLVIEYSLLHHH